MLNETKSNCIECVDYQFLFHLQITYLIYEVNKPTKWFIICGVWWGVGAMRSSSSPLATVGWLMAWT